MRTSTRITSTILALGLAVGTAAVAGAQGSSPSAECGDLSLLTKFDSDIPWESADEGDTYSQDGVTVTVDEVKDEEDEALGVTWTSTTPIDRVVLFSGGASTIDELDEAVSGSISTSNDRAISHVTFCFDQDATPTEPAPSESVSPSESIEPSESVTPSESASPTESVGPTATPTPETGVAGETTASPTPTAETSVEASEPDQDEADLADEPSEPSTAVEAADVEAAGVEATADQLPRTGAGLVALGTLGVGLVGAGSVIVRRR